VQRYTIQPSKVRIRRKIIQTKNKTTEIRGTTWKMRESLCYQNNKETVGHTNGKRKTHFQLRVPRTKKLIEQKKYDPGDKFPTVVMPTEEIR